jgi:hypothetical protein
VLQSVFAWSNKHLYAFRIHSKEYGCVRLSGPHFEDDPRHVPLGQLRLHRGERFTYLYNFIDDWVCDLRLEAGTAPRFGTALYRLPRGEACGTPRGLWRCVGLPTAG